jgi:hypothetical protein
LFDVGKNNLLGPFNSSINKKNGVYSSHLVFGNDIIIELFEPHEDVNQAKFKLQKIIYGYKNIKHNIKMFMEDKDNYDELQSASCQIDVNCPLGDNWCREKFSVTKLNKYFKFNV